MVEPCTPDTELALIAAFVYPAMYCVIPLGFPLGDTDTLPMLGLTAAVIVNEAVVGLPICVLPLYVVTVTVALPLAAFGIA